MKSHYRKAMGHLAPSPHTLENILDQASKPQAWRAPRRTAGIAAAMCAAVALLSAGVVSAYGYFFHDIPDDVAGSLQPVKLTHTSQDITMTVQHASMVDGTLAAYVTLEDISGGNRMAEGVDFYHSYRVNKPDGTEETSYRYQSLGYDEESNTYGFLVTITPSGEDGEALYLQGQPYTLSVGQLLLAQTKSQLNLLPDWGTLPVEPDKELRGCSVWGYVDNYCRQVEISDGKAEVLLPGSWELPLTDSFTVTAAGFLDSGFHVQLRYNDKNAAFDNGELVLVMPDGNVIGNVLGYADAGNFCSVGFQDEYGYEYTEFIYDILLEELDGAVLQGDFTSGGYLLDGSWEVTFSLEQEVKEEVQQ